MGAKQPDALIFSPFVRFRPYPSPALLLPSFAVAGCDAKDATLFVAPGRITAFPLRTLLSPPASRNNAGKRASPRGGADEHPLLL